MITVLLFLLKIILIVLAVLLLIIALILFVPIRYRADGSYLKKTPEGRLEASWLFGFLKLVISYHEKPQGELRLLGIKVYDFFTDVE